MNTKKFTFRLLFCFLICCTPFTIYAESDDSLKLRPDADGSPTPVTVTIFVVDLRDIEGVRQNFTADVLVRLQWKDPRLASNEPFRKLPTSEIWNPGIQIVNRASIQTTLPEFLDVDRDGNVNYRQRFIGEFSCWLNLSEFPFDQQLIPIKIAVPEASTEDITLISSKENGHSPRFSITDWKIKSWKVEAENYPIPGGRSVPGYSFELSVKRLFHFFFVQIIIPMSLILGMSWIAFWLNRRESGPRVSISTTSMLTVVAYRLLLSNFLPRLSYLTRMDYFVVGCTFLVFLSLVTVVYISRLMLANKELRAEKLDVNARWIFPLLFIAIVCFAFVI